MLFSPKKVTFESSEQDDIDELLLLNEIRTCVAGELTFEPKQPKRKEEELKIVIKMENEDEEEKVFAYDSESQPSCDDVPEWKDTMQPDKH
jgi:hypothetical protein